MAKFSRIPKLSRQGRQDLIINFCDALTSVKNKNEAAQLLTDLLSPQELEMLAKRLEIARLLVEGKTYEQIRDYIKVSFNTIARVNAWLTLSGSGFRLVIERTKRNKKSKKDIFDEINDPFSTLNIKRRYSMYFLPQLIIDELIKQSNDKQKKKLVSILDSIEGKRDVFKEVDSRFRDQFMQTKKLLRDTK